MLKRKLATLLLSFTMIATMMPTMTLSAYAEGNEQIIDADATVTEVEVVAGTSKNLEVVFSDGIDIDSCDINKMVLS